MSRIPAPGSNPNEWPEEGLLCSVCNGYHQHHPGGCYCWRLREGRQRAIAKWELEHPVEAALYYAQQEAKAPRTPTVTAARDQGATVTPPAPDQRRNPRRGCRDRSAL